VTPWDPLDADLGLVAAVRRAPDEARELHILEDPTLGVIMEPVLLVPG
jgi:hypothetical protein